jgi:hypothetical protein
MTYESEISYLPEYFRLSLSPFFARILVSKNMTSLSHTIVPRRDQKMEIMRTCKACGSMGQQKVRMCCSDLRLHRAHCRRCKLDCLVFTMKFTWLNSIVVSAGECSLVAVARLNSIALARVKVTKKTISNERDLPSMAGSTSCKCTREKICDELCCIQCRQVPFVTTEIRVRNERCADVCIKKVDFEFSGGLTSGSFCTVDTFIDGVLKDLAQNATLISGPGESTETRASLHKFMSVSKSVRSVLNVCVSI